jgi:ParB-like chromosome segregation protein Spo0J
MKTPKTNPTTPDQPAVLEKNQMAIEWWPLEKIHAYPGNPRKIPEAAVLAVAASLKEFGWRQPLVVDAAGEIIVGHTRFLAAQHLGQTECPVHIAADMPPAQIAAYRIADNRVGEFTDWSNEKLHEEITRLAQQASDSCMTAIGFDQAAIDAMLAKALAPPPPVEIRPFAKIHFLVTALNGADLLTVQDLISRLERLQKVEVIRGSN